MRKESTPEPALRSRAADAAAVITEAEPLCGDEQCDLCGLVKSDVAQDPTSGLFVCSLCIEHTLEALT